MKRFLAILLIAVMLIGMTPAVSGAAQYASVVGGWLRLRAAARFDAETISSYYTGTQVEILGSSGGWYYVRTPDGRTGYMYGQYLRLSASVGGDSQTNAYVTSQNGYGVRLRMGPGTGYRVIRTYPAGTPATVLQRGDTWSKIRIEGTTGYMMSQFLVFGDEGNNIIEAVVCYATIRSENGYGVRLRTGPGMQYDPIGVYSVGTTVAVLQKGQTWDRIRVGSRTGWMMNDFLRYASGNEVTSVTLNTLSPSVGTVMKVRNVTPSNATYQCVWMVGGHQVSTASSYTVRSADAGKCIELIVVGTGKFSGNARVMTSPVTDSSNPTEGFIENDPLPGIIAPTVDDAVLPEATVGQHYSARLNAQGSGPVMWMLEGGHLPDGITLSQGGILSGTPQESGSFAFSVTAENAAGVSGAKSFTLVVKGTQAPQEVLEEILFSTQKEEYKLPASESVAQNLTEFSILQSDSIMSETF